MDIDSHNPTTSDNDALAKVLAGFGGDSHKSKHSAMEEAGLQFEETPAPGEPQDPPSPHADEDKAAAGPVLPVPPPGESELPKFDINNPDEEPETTITSPSITTAAGPPTPQPVIPGDLADLKKAAIEELRPLAAKLDLPPEEKFDTLLLIIRSTDDKTLLEPAHQAAKLITDESRRAQALLDIIKEIDYFGAHGK